MNYEVMITPPSKSELTSGGFNKNILINQNQTADTLLKYGFTNHREPTLYFCRKLTENITFNLSVNKKTLKVEKLDVLDEDFLQPYDYQEILMTNKDHPFAKHIYYKVNDMLNKLQNDGIITGFNIGMYV
ncbi:hypothetical protein SFC65_19125 [Priestia filamentosa]|uniref:hypothetical protein n=1 Tax=Priestia filamentosa TaxID=1402861 RepID=UPI003981EDBE